jgi:hypothetical protein
MCLQADSFQDPPGIICHILLKSGGSDIYHGLCSCCTVIVTTHAIRYHEQVSLSIFQVENGDTILLFCAIADS